MTLDTLWTAQERILLSVGVTPGTSAWTAAKSTWYAGVWAACAMLEAGATHKEICADLDRFLLKWKRGQHS